MLSVDGRSAIAALSEVGSFEETPSHRQLFLQNNWKKRLVEPSPNDFRSAGFTKDLHRGHVLSLSNLAAQIRAIKQPKNRILPEPIEIKNKSTKNAIFLILIQYNYSMLVSRHEIGQRGNK